MLHLNNLLVSETGINHISNLPTKTKSKMVSWRNLSNLVASQLITGCTTAHVWHLQTCHSVKFGVGCLNADFLVLEAAATLPTFFFFSFFFYLKMGQPRPLFVYFRSFQQQFYRKNCRFQRESNSDCRSRRRAR